MSSFKSQALSLKTSLVSKNNRCFPGMRRGVRRAVGSEEEGDLRQIRRGRTQEWRRRGRHAGWRIQI